MGAFRDQSWSNRYTAMGDAAEGQCVAWLDAHDRGWVRYGLDRPPLRMSMLPEFIRHTPDFLTSHSLVECKGFGRDQLGKIKLADWASLISWHKLHPVELFFYDQHNERCIVVPFDKLHQVLAHRDKRIQKDQFNDDPPKPYWAFPADLLAELGETHGSITTEA